MFEARKRCSRHEPKVVDAFHGYVECSKCGRQGLLSNGQTRTGRPRKIIWLNAKLDLKQES